MTKIVKRQFKTHILDPTYLLSSPVTCWKHYAYFYVHSANKLARTLLHVNHGTVRRVKRDQVLKIARLGGSKYFVDKREVFIFNTFVDIKAVERFEKGSDTSEFSSLKNKASKKALNLLEPINLIVWTVVIEINLLLIYYTNELHETSLITVLLTLQSINGIMARKDGYFERTL